MTRPPASDTDERQAVASHNGKVDARYDALKPFGQTPSDEICSHPQGTPIKVMSLAGMSRNPLHCLRCNLEVPPERLDLTPLEGQGVAHWNSMDGAIGWLELDSGPYEAWARAQLLDPNSPVNVIGLRLAKELNVRRPCYFWFFQPQADDDFEPRKACPVCGGALVPYAESIFPQLLCEKDRVVLVGR